MESALAGVQQLNARLTRLEKHVGVAIDGAVPRATNSAIDQSDDRCCLTNSRRLSSRSSYEARIACR